MNEQLLLEHIRQRGPCSRAELARVYHQLGRYGDARALLRDTVDRLRRILPYDDPLIVELRDILADIGEE